jgi:predicted P-loop ATPase
MVLVCNDRGAAERTVESLADFSNPVSLVRLARLHGTGRVERGTLLASERWQAAHAALEHWSDRPPLELDA